MKTIRCIAGKNQIAIDGLQHVLDHHPDCEILFLPNPSDDGINRWQPSFKRFGGTTRAKQVRLEEIYPIRDLVFVSLEYENIIHPSRFASDRLFNIHFSLLPAYKGMYTSAMPILCGEKHTGVTLHRIDAGIDTGDIIAQRGFDIGPNDTARDLYLRYLAEGTDLFRNQIASVVTGDFTQRPQQADGASYFSKAAIDYQNLSIDTRKTAFEVHNQFRAFTFREYQLPVFHGHAIQASRITENRSVLRPGLIADETDDRLVIATIDYDVELWKDPYTRLWNAARSNDVESLARILPKTPDLELRTREGWNALILASYHGALEAVEMLIAHGADPSATNPKGTTVLMYAFSHYEATGDDQAFRTLLKAGADTRASDDSGLTLADYMAMRKNTSLAHLLH